MFSNPVVLIYLASFVVIGLGWRYVRRQDEVAKQERKERHQRAMEALVRDANDRLVNASIERGANVVVMPPADAAIWRRTHNGERRVH